MKTALERISTQRSRLLIDHPWFGSLALRLRVIERTEAECPTMQTDGSRLEFCSTFVDTLSDQELKAVIAHEVCHCAFRHMYRLKGRDLEIANIACDYAINGILIEQKFQMPAGTLFDAKYQGMAWEEIYARLMQEKSDGGGGGKPGNGGKGLPTGTFKAPSKPDKDGKDPNDAEPIQMNEVDWEIAAQQAAIVARKAGKLPGSIEVTLEANKEAGANWREILHRFLERTIPSDYDWLTPNRRHIANGLYLPGLKKENTPRIAIGIDTSGSVDDRTLQVFANELSIILGDVRPEAIDIYYCDTQVRRVESFTPDDELKLTAKGRGGTEFQPVFDKIEESGNTPACLIYFTDLYGPAPKEPEYPVLWATTEASHMQGPFGETIQISEFK